MKITIEADDHGWSIDFGDGVQERYPSALHAFRALERRLLPKKVLYVRSGELSLAAKERILDFLATTDPGLHRKEVK